MIRIIANFEMGNIPEGLKESLRDIIFDDMEFSHYPQFNGKTRKITLISALALFGGLLGAGLTFLLIYYSSTIDYPVSHASKPHFTLMTAIPAAFSIGILFAGLLIFIAYIIKNTSEKHKFGDINFEAIYSNPTDSFLCIACAKAESEEIVNILKSYKAKFIKILNHCEPSIHHQVQTKNRLLKKIIPGIILILPIAIMALLLLFEYEVISIKRKEKPLEIVMDMDYNSKLRTQSENTFFRDGTIERKAPVHTYPRFRQSYKYLPFEFSKSDSNNEIPLPYNDFVASRGKYLFETFCIPCHGAKGKGDGTIITKVELKPDEEGFPKPADLTELKTRQKSNGRLFHILSAGQNLMFPVNDRLSVADRWALVYFIRKLN